MVAISGGYDGYAPMRAQRFTAFQADGPYSTAQAMPFSEVAAGDGVVTTIWVGNLPGTTTEECLYNAYSSEFGQTVLSSKLSGRPAASGARSGFVRFQSQVEANAALLATNGGQIQVYGEALTAQWAKTNSFGGHSPGVPSFGSFNTIAPAKGPVGTLRVAVQPPEPRWQQPPPPTTPAPQSYSVSSPSWGSTSNNSGGKWVGGYGASGSFSPSGGQSAAPSHGGIRIGGQAQQAQVASYARENDELTTLWIGNLPELTYDADVSEAFSAVGQVIVTVVNAKLSNLGHKSGFVRLATRQEAQTALEWCNSGSMTVHGEAILAKWAKANSKARGDASVGSSYEGYNQGASTPVPPANGDIFGFNTPPVSTDNAFQFQPPPPAAPPRSNPGEGRIRTLYLGHLPVTVTEEEVSGALSLVGLECPPGSVLVSRPRGSTISSFIRFEFPEHAQEAYDLLISCPPTIGGKPVQVVWARADSR